jgi:hypothetical protein
MSATLLLLIFFFVVEELVSEIEAGIGFEAWVVC